MKIKLRHGKKSNSFPEWIMSVLNSNDEYTVLGYELLNGEGTFYVDAELNYPLTISEKYVEIVDDRVCPDWSMKLDDNGLKLMFDDWLKSPEFMNCFLNYDPSNDICEWIKPYGIYLEMSVVPQKCDE